MAKWNYDISEWIIKALYNKRLGRNRIYNDHVNKRYKRVNSKNLSKDVFDRHLKFLLQNDIVGKNDAGQRGTIIEHFLIPEAERQYQARTLDLRVLKAGALKNKNKRLTEITSQLKFKALYILILMFNHSSSFEFRNQDEMISFLAPFHLKLHTPSIEKLVDENESEEAKKERRHFRTRIESQDKGVTISIHDYVNLYHDGITTAYNCQIRGMTKNSVILNRIDKPFQYLSFSSDQIEEAFILLHKEKALHPVPHTSSDYVYRIVDNDLYFLLLFLEDLFTEYVMPVMRSIWKYLRNPTTEEWNWLSLLEGKIGARRIMIEDTEHRHEIESEIRQTASGIEIAAKKRLREKKIEKLKEIESQVTTLQEELDNYQKTYKSIINKHTSLQHIFEIMFPKFLRRLELRSSVR